MVPAASTCNKKHATGGDCEAVRKLCKAASLTVWDDGKCSGAGRPDSRPWGSAPMPRRGEQICFFAAAYLYKSAVLDGGVGSAFKMCEKNDV